MAAETAPEFSRMFELADASDRARNMTLAADAGESKALAARFNVKKVTNLAAALTVAPHAKGYLVTGDVEADVEQVCGITSAPVHTHCVSQINVLLWTYEVEGELEMLEDAYEVDNIDPISQTEFDIGELAAQYFGLAIEPFPRAEGASLDAILPQEKANPFSVLAQLKDKA